MKIFQMLLIGLTCVLLLFFGAKAIFDIKPLPQKPDSSEVQSTPETTATPAPSTTPVDSSAQEVDTTKTGLAIVTAPELIGLDVESVQWGPGKNVNDKNQSSACLSLQEKYKDLGSIFIMDTDKVYLSFDLGYEAGFTEAILDTLAANNVKAMFFVTDSYARKQEPIVRRILAEGHTVGNHSTTHKDMPILSDEESAQEIMGMHKTMEDMYGYSPYLFRFPNGSFSEKSLAIAAQNGYHSVFWSFAYNDWDNALQPEYSSALEKTTSSLHNGAVYLLHPMKTNSEILDEFIKNAKQNNFEFGVL